MSTTTYKPISKGSTKTPKNILVEFDDDETPQGEEILEIETPQKVDENETDLVQNDEGQDQTVQERVKPKADKHANRAQKRIKGLVNDVKERDQRLIAAEAEIERLRNLAEEGSKSSKTNLKVKLESQITLLTNHLKKSMQDGDSDKTIDLQDELMNAKLELAGLVADLATTPAKRESQGRPQPQNTVPEAAQDWIEAHPLFNTDQLFHAAALITNNQLINEGYDPESDEFYEEINTRLQPRFPEAFGMKPKSVVSSSRNSVQYVQDDTSSDEETENTSIKPKVQQTVSSASRTQPNQAPKRKSNTVVLTPEHVQQAEKWGLSLEQMARRVAHAEKNRREDGYVSIKIPKN